ncbi:tetratricopeptide repeat protein [Tumidithrix elongata RA019]|uniref:Tetratricopeptide repeat protein n=1 Tax=Tumidithrix elongata BACA0141 TaxID=2716417 RepID=A0AAW9PWE9_9CYAN|nr:tetratricopeptide repeat protein [Tumidithrix elongata RA019]
MASLTAGQRLFAALEIDLDAVPIEYLDDYVAIEYFLILEDEPPADANNLEKVDRYLQVFNHLSEASAWQQASKVLSFRLEVDSKELHDQLRIWGYYYQQIELYQGLLGKVDSEQDLVCFWGLGRIFENLSDFSKSLDYYQQQLDLADLTKNRQAEAKAMDGIGTIQSRQQKYLEASASHQQQLEIAREIGDREQEGYALRGIGWVLFRHGLSQSKIREQQAGLNYLEASLEIAHSICNLDLESESIGDISRIYIERGQYAESVVFLRQQLDFCEKTSNRKLRQSVLGDLGECYTELRQYENALECLQEALKIAGELGDLYSEAVALNRLAVLYGYELQRYEDAIFYCEKDLEISQKLSLNQEIQIPTIINLFNFHAFLNQKEKADFYLKIAKSIAENSESLETKAIVVMALANAYWSRDRIWHKLFGLFLAAKGLLMAPPWRNSNGRIALQLTIAALTKSAKNVPIAITQRMKKFLNKSINHT